MLIRSNSVSVLPGCDCASLRPILFNQRFHVFVISRAVQLRETVDLNSFFILAKIDPPAAQDFNILV